MRKNNTLKDKAVMKGAILSLVVGSMFFGVSTTSADVVSSTDSSILTTTQLRNLPVLKETDVIKPTGEVKTFTLDIKPNSWELVQGTKIDGITVNGSIPGPEIRVKEGDTVRITVKNNLKEETSIHWHGLHVPNNMDGVPPFTQQAIKPGSTFTYEFIANHAGTFMYHSHQNSVEQIDKGFYGAFIIDPQNSEKQPKFDQDVTWMLGGWIVDESKAKTTMSGMSSMESHDMANMSGMNMKDTSSSSAMNMNYNYWTINGKAFPDTKPIVVKKGDVVRLRLLNISNVAHPMHLHGHDFRVIAEDGHPIAQPQVMNTIDVAPGKTFDIEFIADNPGTWVFHCHELHHTMNGEVEPGGLIGVIQYDNANKTQASKPPVANTNMQESTSNYYTANEGGSVTKIDAMNNKIVETIPVEGSVHNVQVSPDKKVFAATVVPEMNGHDTATENNAKEHGHESSAMEEMKMNGQVYFFNTKNDQLIKKVEVGQHPAHVIFTKDGKYVLITNNEDNNVTVLNAKTYDVVKTIQTGNGPHGFRISDDSKFAYVANMAEDTVSVLDLTNLKELRKIRVGQAPVQTGITPDGKTLVATINKENALAIVDLVSGKVDKVPVGVGPAQVFVQSDGKIAFVANQGTEANPSNTLTKIDLSTKKVVATIQTGKGTHGVVTSSDNKLVYVTNMFEDTVSVIDNQTNKVIQTIKVAGTPNGISFQP